MASDKCPQCGERLEPGFTSCWKCGETIETPAYDSSPASNALEFNVDETDEPLDAETVDSYWATEAESSTPDKSIQLDWANITVTTAPTLEGYRVIRTIDIVTAECVYGVNALRDWLASISDVVGGRSSSSQNILRSARLVCLRELRQEAMRLGANAVIAVDLDYSEISGGGKSMLFLVASGTAVVVEPVAAPSITPNEA